jgi:3-oxoacyl-[acyl-carrier-protein] synthase-3
MLQRLTGVQERRYANADEASSDLAARAASRALSGCRLDREAIDVVIFAAASHDVAEPATANRVQELLGCEGARAVDVKNACNSFLDAIDLARCLIRSSAADHVLVATGEIISRFVSLQASEQVSVVELIAGLTLGDAGAAAVVSADRGFIGAEILPGSFASFGSHWQASTILAGGTWPWTHRALPYFVSDSRAILDLAMTHVPKVVGDALCLAGWEDIDLVVPHQASVALIRKMAAVLNIPLAKCIITGDVLGNTAAASIPVALSIALQTGRIKRGARVLLAGGAAGFSAAAVPLQFP